MNNSIATGICMIASLVASFLLFAIAFNTPFPDLRSSYVPIYIGLIVVCSIASVLAPHRIIVILISALFLPTLMLCYVGSQRSEYYIDAATLVLVCALAATCASNAVQWHK
jgi:hypothetical protein